MSVINYRTFNPCKNNNHEHCRVEFEDDGIVQRCDCISCGHVFEEVDDVLEQNDPDDPEGT